MSAIFILLGVAHWVMAQPLTPAQHKALMDVYDGLGAILRFRGTFAELSVCFLQHAARRSARDLMCLRIALLVLCFFVVVAMSCECECASDGEAKNDSPEGLQNVDKTSIVRNNIEQHWSTNCIDEFVSFSSLAPVPAHVSFRTCMPRARWLSRNLYSNLLSGTIVSQIGQLTSLDLLLLNYNRLRSSLPTSIGRLTRLTRLYFNDNRISGSLHSVLGRLTALIECEFWVDPPPHLPFKSQ